MLAAALSHFQAAEDRRNMTRVLTNVGYAALAWGEFARARALFAESLEFGREHGDQFITPAYPQRLGAIAAAVGDPHCAVRIVTTADERSAATGAKRLA